MMIAVAIFALAFGGVTMRRRQIAFRALASSHEKYEILYRENEIANREDALLVQTRIDRYRELLRNSVESIPASGFARAMYKIHRTSDRNLMALDEKFASNRMAYASRLKLCSDFHRALRLKYEHAARFPWLPVAPDPPSPDL
jgi:hypothetical protein